MKQRSVALLCVILVVVAALGYVAINGLEIGLYNIKPLGSEIKQGLDLTGGVSVVYQAVGLSGDELSEGIDQAIVVFRSRLTEEGFPEATISKQGTDRVRIEIPINESSEIQDPNMITEYLVKPAKVEFRSPDGDVIVEGKDMVDVGVSMGASGQDYVVSFSLTSEASTAFYEATVLHSGNTIGIYLDDALVSNPKVNDPIAGGNAMIEGQFTYDEARLLANQIKSGVMPIDMEEIEVRSISATLGDQALERSLMAGLIGVAIVMVFMLVMYRIPGLVADIALCIYMLIVFFALATIPGVQLTLPGIAGIILSIGMAVDANVVIFERFKEELVAGKSLRTSAKSGFSRAFSAILDSNVTTIIAAVVLMFFGTGPIQGFAVTLLIGIVTSFFTAVFISRGLLTLFLNMGINRLSLFANVKGGRAS